MPQFRIYGKVYGTKYLGTVEAESAEYAVDNAYDDPLILRNSHITNCYKCSSEVELQSDVEEVYAEEDN